jgi:hypothetical protein
VGASFRYDEIFHFDVSHDALWDALTDIDSYPRWWPWLRSFDADGLAPGTVARCAVRAPLPYTLEFDVHVERVEAGRSIDTRVTGDLVGPARLEVAGDVDASTARLTWAVDLRMPVLSAASFVARPLLVWAHDRVVSNGVEQFRAHALTRPRDLD